MSDRNEENQLAELLLKRIQEIMREEQKKRMKGELPYTDKDNEVRIHLKFRIKED